MNNKKLIKKLKLDEIALKRIEDAIHQAEKNTDGEIAVAMASESDHYSFWELLYANILTAIILVLLLPISPKINQVINLLYWHVAPVWILPGFYVCVFLCLIVLIFYLSNFPLLDRLIVPGRVKYASVYNRALRYFCESGVYKTSNHSGILIYISYMERQVRIIADSGISQKISENLWTLIADELSEDIKKNNFESGILNAISKCGELLAENFPKSMEKKNQLSDSLAIIEP